MKTWLFLFLPLLVAKERPRPPDLLANPAEIVQAYQRNLIRLRQRYPTGESLPDLTFFLFGMGNRMKLIYRKGRLLDALTGNIELQWNVQREIIVPSEYTVQLTIQTEPGTAAPTQLVQIREDETGVWILQADKRPRLLRGTRSPLNLPRFADNINGSVLRVLLQEVLMNVMDGKLLPNFLVYNQPIPQDAAPMLAVLRMTENEKLVDTGKNDIPDPIEHDGKNKKNRISSVDYPLSWQYNAPGAHYPGLTVLEKTLVRQKLITPHAGHAADLFLDLNGKR